MDCWGCRAAHARFCAVCVQHAAAEREKSLADVENENRRLQNIIVAGISKRARLLMQAHEKREHEKLVAQLSSSLATVRCEADQLAITVNELRHMARRSSARFARVQATSPGCAMASALESVELPLCEPSGDHCAHFTRDACLSRRTEGIVRTDRKAEALRHKLSERRRLLLWDLLGWATVPSSSLTPPAQSKGAVSDGSTFREPIPQIAGTEPGSEPVPQVHLTLVLFQHLTLPPPLTTLGQCHTAAVQCTPLSVLLGPSVPQRLPEAEAQAYSAAWAGQLPPDDYLSSWGLMPRTHDAARRRLSLATLL
eukprot:scaffold280718_cov33-Tisochrysis_lutea.AAC.1